MKKVIYLLILAVTLLLIPNKNTYAQTSMESTNTLTAKQKSIIAISALTAQGELQSLQLALNQGLDKSLTINEIKEILVHLYAYCGFPRSIRGLQTVMEVLDERQAKGINDNSGAEASPITDERSKYEQGKANLEKLVGRPLPEIQSGYAAFAPIIEVFLKEHLFADLFQRDVLTFAERELVTISVIAAIGKAEPMLRAHFGICLNVGYTPEQLNEFVVALKSSAGKREAKAAQSVLDGILDKR
ncbi:carboxymuconolactone decarboxylase family protein [Mangrovibacterium sp.]|uniref:carboxymuconolactone decarboxylase family protein n=1 Tax=Mangrovibacterium sp. TaxID=1961364 RepID=UPI00356A28A4